MCRWLSEGRHSLTHSPSAAQTALTARFGSGLEAVSGLGWEGSCWGFNLNHSTVQKAQPRGEDASLPGEQLGLGEPGATAEPAFGTQAELGHCLSRKF